MATENEQLIQLGIQFFNEDRVNVTRRIAKEQTFAFTCYKQAQEKARQLHSYVYDLYGQDKIQKRATFFGYAVPK